MSEVSQFYTGLVAKLYDALAGNPGKASDYANFVARANGPVLELACGSGSPLLDLVAMGHDVAGLDSSLDMLNLCQERATARGLSVTLYHQTIERMSIPTRFAAIFLAGPSFNLLPDDSTAQAGLDCIYEHLRPGGRILIPLFIPGPPEAGLTKESIDADGAQLRYTALGGSLDVDRRIATTQTRYERTLPGQPTEMIERDWVLHYWSPPDFVSMLTRAGFTNVSAVLPGGAPADEGAQFFFMRAQRS